LAELLNTAHYIALIHKDPDSGYGVSFPAVLGVTAVADTLDDAISEAAITLGFALENWDGEHPVPRPLDALRKDSQFIEWSADAIVAAIPAPTPISAA
jgi:predicted RNase H-like HicB family nuclease